MSERYPVRWRAACLELLQARKHELHAAVGYKKMSWEPICKEVLACLVEFWGRPSFYDDNRLSRQNLDSWDKGKELKDGKFELIDLYVRSLALSGQDSRALILIREWRAKEAASALSTLYARTSGTKALPEFVIAEQPWTLSSGEIAGTWFRSVVIRATSTFAGVTSVLVAYLPVRVDSFQETDFRDVVFFEGFLFPLEISDGLTEAGDPADRTICSLKLVRPEFRGLSGVGYADGELHIKSSKVPSLTSEKSKIYTLEFSSPAICPVVSEEWADKAASVNFNRVISRLSGSDTFVKSRSITLGLNYRQLDIIDKLFNLSYRGYVQ